MALKACRNGSALVYSDVIVVTTNATAYPTDYACDAYSAPVEGAYLYSIDSSVFWEGGPVKLDVSFKLDSDTHAVTTSGRMLCQLEAWEHNSVTDVWDAITLTTMSAVQLFVPATPGLYFETAYNIHAVWRPLTVFDNLQLRLKFHNYYIECPDAQMRGRGEILFTSIQ